MKGLPVAILRRRRADGVNRFPAGFFPWSNARYRGSGRPVSGGPPISGAVADPGDQRRHLTYDDRCEL